MSKPAFDFRGLSVPERLYIPVPSDVLVEAERRLAEHRADPNSAIPWEEVRAELHKSGA